MIGPCADRLYAVLPTGVATRMPSAISSSIRTTPSTLIRSFAAQRNDDFGALRGNARVPRAQLFESLLRGVGLGRDDSNPRRRRTSHPPVTLIWRATAGR